MLQVILGLACTIAPFTLISRFEDKRRGFVWVAFGLLSFHLVLGLLSQAFGFFSYPVITAVHVIACFSALGWVLWKGFSGVSVSWKASLMVLSAVAIIVLQLSSVHYDYTGPVMTARGEALALGDSYPYPLFSDEWVASSYVSTTLETGSLPLVNPLWEGERAVNLLAPFYSLISELSLFFGLDPVTGIPVLAIVFGTLVCVSVMMLVRSMGGSLFASLFAGLCIPFIANGSNLPGVWFLLPFAVALVPLLWFLSALSFGSERLALACAFLSVLIYPPSAVFIVPAGIAFIMGAGAGASRRVLILMASLMGATLLGLVVAVSSGGADVMARVASGLFHANLDGGIASYSLLKVIPWPLAPFAFYGLLLAWKREHRHIVAAIAAGLVGWVFYTVYSGVIVIEHPRVVMITSVLLVALSGIGVSKVIERRWGGIPATLSVILVAALLSFFYPWGTAWRDMTLSLSVGNQKAVVRPAPPVNRYLHPDDLRLFAGISGERFIAQPWKGLVIGSATGNYPLESKASTITNRYVLYADFMSTDCAGKTSMAREWSVSYVYSDPFTCDGFIEVGSSSEGFVLYDVRTL